MKSRACLREALEGVHGCIAEGLPVIGYFYWSLLYNFEWKHGYGMNFRLAGVDRSTQIRCLKPSLMYPGAIGRESGKENLRPSDSCFWGRTIPAGML